MSNNVRIVYWLIEQLDHRTNPTRLYFRLNDGAWVGKVFATRFKRREIAEAYQREFGIVNSTQVTCHDE